MTTEDIIRSNIEPNEPADSILAFLRTIEGKKITQRHVEKLREQLHNQDVRLRKQYGMTFLHWSKDDSLLLDHSETNVTIDIDRIFRHNAAYYSARDERNAVRRQALAQPAKCDELDKTIKAYNQAKKNLVDMLDDPLFDPDRFTIREQLVEGKL